jgi:hypothetical protein
MLNSYLSLVGTKHSGDMPYHPQTNKKVERYHHMVKGEVNLLPNKTTAALKEAIRSFVDY